ncbi:MAG: hypothetical protein M0P33_01950 [Massilibacteroides sp.]|nr:hypothetical protein [Massilibacteroides sp.]
MKKNDDGLRTLAMLRYQADRYQSVGNGCMVQSIRTQIDQLSNKLRIKAV